MKIALRIPLTACVLAAALAGAAASQAQPAAPETLFTVPGDRIENVYEAKDGSLYFTSVFSGKVMRLAPGQKTPTAFFAVHSPQGIVETPTGFVVDYQDRDPNFAGGDFNMKGLGAHIAILDRNGRVLRTYDGIDSDAFYNGMALGGPDTLFVADAGGDRIFKIALSTGKTEVWLDKGQTGATPGAPNGLKVHNGWVYYARGDVYRIKIGADGKPSGAPELAAKTGGTDDFDVAAGGTVYASNRMDVAAVTPSGEITKAVVGQCQFCTSARVSPDGRTLYFAGGSVRGVASMPVVDGFLRKVALPAK